MQRRKTFIFLGTGVLLVGIFLGMQVRDVISEDNSYRQLRKLEEAFSYISRNYVESVDSAKLAEDAIAGMLKGLDPHSIYVDAEQMRRVRENFDAAFEGIGIYYEMIDGPGDRDTLAVLMPITGGPSEEAGLHAGDRIIQIGDTTAIGFTQADVEKYLKGPKGTQVRVRVMRPGFANPIDFTITRDKIPLNTVVATYMIDEKTGYIKLQRFARTTYTEFADAMAQLKGQGMQRLVFDLRGNAGGLMEMAVRISDEFLKRGQKIVYTQGRLGEYNREYRATGNGAYQDMPVILLVDDYSASASEIVAGAMQDHDRALIVGRRTFGKGLVQQQFPLSDGSVLQMTISRYYTPAGRLIQTPYAQGDDDEEYIRSKQDLRVEANGRRLQGVVNADELGESLPDSLKFRTDGGRTVYGGGGILPDYLVPGDTLSAALRTTIRKSLDNEYARIHLDRHGESFRRQWQGRQTEFLRDYRLSPADFEAFLAYAAQRGVQVVDRAPAEADSEAVFVRGELDAARPDIEARVKAFIARRMYGVDAFYPAIQVIDRTLIESLRLWPAATELAVNSRGRR
jgi:carboxyl-terminal processing protease